jgi:hypothetical protein
VSEYQPRNQGGWPQQPQQPQFPQGQGGNDGQQGGFGQPGSFGQQGGYGPNDETYAQPSAGQQGSYAPGQQGAYRQQGQYGQQPSPGPGQSGWTPQGYPQMQRSQRAPRPGKRRHPLRWIIGIVVVLIAAFVVADQIAKAAAENQVAQKIESSGVNVKPSVNIEGWPFLTQLLSKDINAIDISTGVIKSGNYEITSVTARATGVHLSSLSENASARVDHITGTATIAYSSLNANLGNAIGADGAVTVSQDPSAGNDAIQVQSVGGLVSVVATVKQTRPNQITIHFGSLGGFASLLGGAASIPDQVINIPKLPAGLVIDSIDITSQGIVATASASNTTLSQ